MKEKLNACMGTITSLEVNMKNMNNIEKLKENASKMNMHVHEEHDPDFITITVRDITNGNGVREQISQHMYYDLRYPDDVMYEIIFNLIMKIIRARLEDYD